MHSYSQPPILLLCSLIMFCISILGAEEEKTTEQSELELIEQYFNMSPEELYNLSTTLTIGTEYSWLQTPSATFLLTQEELWQSGHKHIAEQLRMFPGMLVSRTSSNIWAVSTRSFQRFIGNKQLVLQDGREIYTPMFGGVFWETADLPVEILDSIEVIRGPGSSQWGSNAMNGIINIKTLHALEAQENLVTVGGGNKDFGLLSFRQGGEALGGHYYTWGKWYNSHELQDLNDHSKPEFELQKIGVRADLPGFGEKGWTLQAEYFDFDSTNRFLGPALVSPTNAPTLLPDYLGKSTAQGAMVQGKWSGTFAENFDWNLNSYFNHDHRIWDANSLDFNIDTFEADFQVGTNIGQHSILAGYRYRHHRYKLQELPVSSTYTSILGTSALPLFNFSANHAREHIHSLFLQDTLDITENLHLLLGTKYEENEVGKHWMPTARLWWTPDPKSTYWLSYSQALQLPGFFFREADMTTTYMETTPGTYTPISNFKNPALEPTELQQFEIGYRKIFSDNVSLDFTSFYGEYDKLILTGEHLAGKMFNNEDSADSYGGEITLNWHPNTSLQVRSSLSYSETNLIGPGANTSIFSSSKWRGNIIANYRPNQKFTYHLGIYGVDRAQPTVPGYIRTDIGTTYTPNPDWEFRLQIQNLFDPSHPEDHNQFIGLLHHEIPRTAYLQIRRWF